MKIKIPIALSLLWLLGCEAQNSVDTTQPNTASYPNITNAQCKNLHKVTDIDDLLYQMYSNIDSHCLFEMPTEELEKIWGIRIFDTAQFAKDYPNHDEEKRKEIVLEMLRFTQNKENKGIYLQKLAGFETDSARFRIGYIGEQAERNRSFTSPYPKILPKPIFLSFRSITTATNGTMNVTFFRWVNSSWDRKKPLLEIHNGNIHFYNNLLDVETNSTLPLMNTWSTYHGKKSQ